MINFSQFFPLDNSKKTANSLRTLGVMFYCMMKKSNGFLQAVLPDEDLAETMKNLIQHCNDILISELLDSPRDICLKLLLIILTGIDSLNENIIVESLMINNLFDPFIRLLNDPEFHNCEFGHDVVLLITLLVNYRKNQGTNPYVVQLSILADEYALNSFGQIISSKLIEFCRNYMLNLEGHSTSWLSSLSNIVGNMFISDDDTDRTLQIRANNALLLALYENIHLNRNFVTTLAHTQNESSPPSPSNTLQSTGQSPDLATAPIIEVTPTNLFVALFEYCSIVMKDYKPESIVNCKLCFLILTCISEDSYANTLMHDENLNFKVTIHRAQMRHRKLPIDKSSKPLASTLFELIIEFVVSHMIKQKFPIELYLLSVGIIHRLLVYQKRCHVRLNFEWKNLWAALISLLKFLVYQEPYLVKKCNIFTLATQVVNIFNLFIAYGDTFLKKTSMYDELYYELNREEKIFSEIHACGKFVNIFRCTIIKFLSFPVLRYTAMTDCEYKEDVLKLLSSLANILAIIKHFQIKIKEWLVKRSMSTPTEEQILSVVRENYDLTLKLQENLDSYERYNESKHGAFFNAIITDVICDLRTKNCAKFLTDGTTN